MAAKLRASSRFRPSDASTAYCVCSCFRGRALKDVKSFFAKDMCCSIVCCSESFNTPMQICRNRLAPTLHARTDTQRHTYARTDTQRHRDRQRHTHTHTYAYRLGKDPFDERLTGPDDTLPITVQTVATVQACHYEARILVPQGVHRLSCMLQWGPILVCR